MHDSISISIDYDEELGFLINGKVLVFFTWSRDVIKPNLLFPNLERLNRVLLCVFPGKVKLFLAELHKRENAKFFSILFIAVHVVLKVMNQRIE